MSAWVDIFAPPASGKSSICDPLADDRAIERQWGGGFDYPADWRMFLETLPPLLELIRPHERPVPTRSGSTTSINAMVGMLNRNLRKMAVVSQMQGAPYIGTAFAMRGVGIGWRLLDMGYDPRLVRSYFWTMPVSTGCAYLKCSPETLKMRNRARRDVVETSWEDRSFQIDLQLPVIEILKEVLRERGVPLLELDTEHQSIEDARDQLVDFAYQGASYREALRSGGEVAVLPASA